MNSFYAAATIILAETSLALLAIIAVLVFSDIRRKRSNKNALAKLTENLRQKEAGRLTALKAILKDNYHYPDDQLDGMAAGIVKAEMLYYQELMNVFSSRNGAIVDNFDQKIDPLIDEYRKLVPQSSSQNPAGATTVIHQDSDAAALSAKLEQLKAENDKLSKELHTAKEELETTVSEFAKTYGGGDNNDPDAPAPVAKVAEPESAAASPPPQKPQPEAKAPVSPATSADSADQEGGDLLKDIDIDLSDISLDDEADKPSEAKKPSSSSDTDIDINLGDLDIDIPGIDEALEKKSVKEKS